MTFIEELESIIQRWRDGVSDGPIDACECSDELETLVKKWKETGVVVIDEL